MVLLIVVGAPVASGAAAAEADLLDATNRRTIASKTPHVAKNSLTWAWFPGTLELGPAMVLMPGLYRHPRASAARDG